MVFVVQFTLCALNNTIQEVCGAVCFWLTTKHIVNTAGWQVSILWANFFCYVLLTWPCLLTAFVIKHQDKGRICAVKGTVTNSTKLPSRHSPHAALFALFLICEFYSNTSRCVYDNWNINKVYLVCISIHCIVIYQTAQTWLDNKTQRVVQDVEGYDTDNFFLFLLNPQHAPLK
jgi:hypothetical protein